MGLVIRPADRADVPAMHAIRLAVRENRLSDAGAIGEVSYLPFVNGGGAWVALAHDRIVGFAALDFARASVWALFVDPAAEGLGAGRALQERMLAAAAERGLTRLELTTSPGTRADLFYRRAGWTPLELTEAGELRFERKLDATNAPLARVTEVRARNDGLA